MSKAVSDIRITNPFIKELVASEQEQRGDGTATKTAESLIRERFAQLEMLRGKRMGKPRRERRAVGA